MNILVVGNAHERLLGAKTYGFERKLFNGFVRNGHNVQFFSDRDVARNGTIFGSSRAGRGAANRKFLAFARNFAPDLVVFVYSSLIASDTFEAARRLRPGLRLAQVCMDPLWRPICLEFVRDRAPVVDATFVTTAGPVLAQFAKGRNRSSYLPNPVDPSIETGRGFARSDQRYDVFWAARAGKGDYLEDPRVVFALHLAASGQVEVDYHGIGDRPQLFSHEFFLRLNDCRMGLNLNSDRLVGAAAPALADELRLYNSDRIAQVVGCGLLAISTRANGIGELFEEGREMVFADTKEELLETVLRYKHDDTARRRVAEAGWRKGHEQFNERLAAQYIEDVTFERPLSHAYAWPTQLW
jgi:hypothetical protein